MNEFGKNVKKKKALIRFHLYEVSKSGKLHRHRKQMSGSQALERR